MEPIGTVSTVIPGRQPLGVFTVSVDANGRVKLPVKIREFLERFPEKTFFCTTLDERMGLLYPIPVWDKHQEFLDAAEDRDTAKRVKFRAQVMGAEIDIDGQGRMTLPPQMRAGIRLQGAQDLRMIVDRGVVQILTQAVYEAITREGEGDPVADVNKLEKAGMGKGI